MPNVTRTIQARLDHLLRDSELKDSDMLLLNRQFQYILTSILKQKIFFPHSISKQTRILFQEFGEEIRKKKQYSVLEIIENFILLNHKGKFKIYLKYDVN